MAEKKIAPKAADAKAAKKSDGKTAATRVTKRRHVKRVARKQGR